MTGGPLSRARLRATKGREQAVGRRLLSVSLFVIAGGLLAQATLAGMFFTAAAREARIIHLLVGAFLPLLGIIPAVAAWRRAGRAVVTRSDARLVTLLLVLLWVQKVLGQTPIPWTTAIHVPLGVVLFYLSLHLALRARSAGA